MASGLESIEGLKVMVARLVAAGNEDVALMKEMAVIIDAKNARIKELEEALRPFANAVFNHNGDVTYDLSQFSTDDMFRAYRVLRRAALAGK